MLGHILQDSSRAAWFATLGQARGGEARNCGLRCRARAVPAGFRPAGTSSATAGRHGFDPGLLVESDLDQLAVIPAKEQCRLLAIRRLAPHLDSSHGPPAFSLDLTLDLGLPAAVSHADFLGHAEAGTWGVLRLRRSGNHACDRAPCSRVGPHRGTASLAWVIMEFRHCPKSSSERSS